MPLLIHKEQNGERYRFGFKLRYYTYKKNYDLLVLNLLKEIRKKYSVEYTVYAYLPSIRYLDRAMANDLCHDLKIL